MQSKKPRFRCFKFRKLQNKGHSLNQMLTHHPPSNMCSVCTKARTRVAWNSEHVFAKWHRSVLLGWAFSRVTVPDLSPSFLFGKIKYGQFCSSTLSRKKLHGWSERPYPSITQTHYSMSPPGGSAADIYNMSLWTRVRYLSNQDAPPVVHF